MSKVSFELIMSEYNRMCNSYNECEEGCPLFKYLDGYGVNECVDLFREDSKLVEQVILGWRKENPQDSNELLFIKKFKGKPWAELNKDGFSRCGYESCNENLPCNDCPWWKEPLSPTEEEKIYEKPVKIESNERIIEGNINTHDEDENESEGELEGQVTIEEVLEEAEENENVEEPEESEEETVDDTEEEAEEEIYLSDEDLDEWESLEEENNEQNKEETVKVERRNYNPELKDRVNENNFRHNKNKNWNRR